MNLNAAMEDESTEVLNSVGPVLSLMAVKPSFAEFLAIVDVRTKTAGQIKVQDEDSQKVAVALVGEAKRIIRDIDARKKALKEYKEAKGFLDNLNSFAKGLTEKFEKIVSLADPKVKQYMAKVELERRQQAEKARIAAKELQDKIDRETAAANKKAADEAAQKAADEAKASNPDIKQEEIEQVKTAAVAEAATHAIEAPQVATQIFEPSSKITRTDTGVSAFTKKPWIFEITDEEKIPREFCSADKTKIRDAIKRGVRDLPGCRIFEDTQVNYRT